MERIVLGLHMEDSPFLGISRLVELDLEYLAR
jgi:hypothetical protein